MSSDRLSTAIIFYGLLHRSLKFTADGIHKNLLAPLKTEGDVDLYYHTWDVSKIINPRSRDDNLLLDVQTIADLLPGAQGLIESQETFDLSKDWELLFVKNIMRNCTETEAEARYSLMNLCRAQESLQRAWHFFCQAKNRIYDRVVISRADLIFFSPFQAPDVSKGLWIPQFHSWDGVNDRFVIGQEKELQVYTQRVAFTDQWLTQRSDGNSEQILKSWLELNTITVQFFDYYFFRVRANGQLAQHDHKLMLQLLKSNKFPELASQIKLKSETPKTAQYLALVEKFKTKVPVNRTATDRFLILTRSAGHAASNLFQVLSALGKTELIVDQPEAQNKGLWYPDELLQGYEHIMGSAHFSELTAWSRAFYHLEQDLHDQDSVWFIEDDVSGHPEAFKALINQCQHANPDLAATRIYSQKTRPGWYWWKQAADLDWFEQPRSSFNPLCRLSARLIREVLRLRSEKQRFMFHEILFASVAFKHQMVLLDFERQDNCCALLGDFRWRPEVARIHPGISHPVKNPLLHTLNCGFEQTNNS